VTRISSLAGSATQPASPLLRRKLEASENAEMQTTALEGNTDE
jgi:hypothetical protein